MGGLRPVGATKGRVDGYDERSILGTCFECREPARQGEKLGDLGDCLLAAQLELRPALDALKMNRLRASERALDARQLLCRKAWQQRSREAGRRGEWQDQRTPERHHPTDRH